jgi:hypothetical protein
MHLSFWILHNFIPSWWLLDCSQTDQPMHATVRSFQNDTAWTEVLYNLSVAQLSLIVSLEAAYSIPAEMVDIVR